MELILLRHAEASPVDDRSPRDEDRPLTPRGREDAEAVGRGLLRLDLVPTTILTSPLIRAVQTADAISKGCRHDISAESADPLSPGATPAGITTFLQERETNGRTLLVGHQPDLGRLLSFLISGGSMELEFSIKPGAVAVVDLDGLPLRAPGRLSLFAQPAFFAALAGA